MALNVSALAKVIREAPQKDLPNAFKKMGEEISKYLNQNTEIDCSWVGVAGNSTDPITKVSAKVSGINIQFKFVGNNNRSSGMLYLSTKIKQGVAQGVGSPKVSGFSFALPLAPKAMSIPLIILITGPDQIACSTQMATQILNWYKTIIPMPSGGSHGAYTGTVTPIIIK